MMQRAIRATRVMGLASRYLSKVALDEVTGHQSSSAGNDDFRQCLQVDPRFER